MTIRLFDHDSRVLANHTLPKELVEPVLLISKIRGFQNVNEYIVDLVEDDLISVKEGGQGPDKMYESITEYLTNIEYLEKLYPSDPNAESVKDYVKVKLDLDKYKKLSSTTTTSTKFPSKEEEKEDFLK